jgi:thiamine monophosphate synthase
VFGPVFSTASHPGAAPVGVEMLNEVVRAAACPVYAIGGINATNAGQCREAGAYGVAVLSAVWQADDVAGAVRAIIGAVGYVGITKKVF